MDILDVCKALSNETRLQILEWLKEPEKHFPPQESGDMKEIGVCVSHIHDKVGLSQSTVSHFLLKLERAGLLTSHRVGKWTYYKRNEENIQKIAEYIKHKL
ncbi:ArsR/SmtB family transcription factor [Brevibacillus sp. H7]|uniref:ArsR/SmtB family transcription factor n=1 Tax=Brevibacillus sp. H7 TaxID=3349138 RepID=UPI00380153A7